MGLVGRVVSQVRDQEARGPKVVSDWFQDMWAQWMPVWVVARLVLDQVGSGNPVGAGEGKAPRSRLVSGPGGFPPGLFPRTQWVLNWLGSRTSRPSI